MVVDFTYELNEVYAPKATEEQKKTYIKQFNSYLSKAKKRNETFRKFEEELSDRLGVSITAQSALFGSIWGGLSRNSTTKEIGIEPLKYNKKTGEIETASGRKAENYITRWQARITNILNPPPNLYASTLASERTGKGKTLRKGIYEETAIFLNMFLPEDRKISTAKTRFTQNTKKGVREDIFGAYKYLQEQGKLVQVQNFWDLWRRHKERTAGGAEYIYNDENNKIASVEEFAKSLMEEQQDSPLKRLTEALQKETQQDEKENQELIKGIKKAVAAFGV